MSIQNDITSKLNLIGNKELLNLRKIAFLCSRKVPASVVLKCYDCAIAQREAGNCVISGFHSQIEKDVLHYLLKGIQPIIVVLGWGLKEKIESDLQKPLHEGRLLIISPFDKSVKRVNSQTADLRNKMMLELADSVCVGFANPGGKLEKQLNSNIKPVSYLFP